MLTNIPKPNGEKKILNHDGDTMDIVRGILKWDGRDDKAFCQFASQFPRTKEGLKELWKFVKYRITYKEDSEWDGQVIQSPRALWHSGVGDCKSKTLFVNQVLRCLGIPYIIRFVAFGTQRDYTHVYSIAVLDGQQIILDTVYYYFDSEKPYTRKKDYKSDMVKITAISGLSEKFGIDESVVQKQLREIREKQSYAPPTEFIPFSRLTIGEARAEILRQRLQVKKAMDPQNARVYDEGIKLVDRQLTQPDFHRHNTISGVGIISNEAQNIARLLTKYANEQMPAMYQKRKPVSSIGYANVPFIGKIGALVQTPWLEKNLHLLIKPTTGSSAMDVKYRDAQSIFNGSGEYLYAITSGYKKTKDSTVKDENGNSSKLLAEVWRLAKKYLGESLADTYCGGVPYQCLPAKKMYDWKRGTAYYEIKRDTSNPNYSGTVTDAQFNAIVAGNMFGAMPGFNEPCFIFPSVEYRDKFLQEIRLISGIPDAYINDIFQDRTDASLGNGFMYGFCTDVIGKNGNKLTIADYPNAVNAKWARHVAYIAACAQFSGVDDSIIKDLGRRNVAFNQDGKEPEQQLKAMMNWKNPQIAEPFSVVVGAIVGIIAAVTALVSGVMGIVKATSNSVEPNNVPQDFDPIGPALQFDADDWQSGGGGGNTGGGGGGNTGGGGGGNTGGGGGGNTGGGGGKKGGSGLIWAGAAALGGYGLYKYFKSKNK